MKVFRLLVLCLPIALMITVWSCSKEEAIGEDQITLGVDGDEADPAGMIVATPITPVPAVDLEIFIFTSNIADFSTNCGPNLPDASCATGPHGFQATIAVRNNGPGTLPAGRLEIEWSDVTLGGAPQLQIVTRPTLAPGEFFRINRSFFLGPCDCPPPVTFFTRTFQAVVDPNNKIPETNENNNTATYTVCDGC